MTVRPPRHSSPKSFNQTRKGADGCVLSQSIRVNETDKKSSMTCFQSSPRMNVKNKELRRINSPFAPSGSNYLNFKLSVESSTQSQPLQDVLL